MDIGTNLLIVGTLLHTQPRVSIHILLWPLGYTHSLCLALHTSNLVSFISEHEAA